MRTQIEAEMRELHVISYREITSDVEIRSAGVVRSRRNGGISKKPIASRVGVDREGILDAISNGKRHGSQNVQSNGLCKGLCSWCKKSWGRTRPYSRPNASGIHPLDACLVGTKSRWSRALTFIFPAVFARRAKARDLDVGLALDDLAADSNSPSGTLDEPDRLSLDEKVANLREATPRVEPLSAAEFPIVRRSDRSRSRAAVGSRISPHCLGARLDRSASWRNVGLSPIGARSDCGRHFDSGRYSGLGGAQSVGSHRGARGTDGRRKNDDDCQVGCQLSIAGTNAVSV